MKTLLISFLIVISQSFFSYGQRNYVFKKNGVYYIKHSVQQNENIAQIAKDYSTRPNILTQFNQLGNASTISFNDTLAIPLLETNFFKFASLTDAPGFVQVIYKVNNDLSSLQICKQFGIALEAFQRWNPSIPSNESILGEEVIVGWLKYSSSRKNTITIPAKTFENNTSTSSTKINENATKPVVPKKVKDKNISVDQLKQKISSTSNTMWTYVKKPFIKKEARTNKNEVSAPKTNKESQLKTFTYNVKKAWYKVENKDVDGNLLNGSIPQRSDESIKEFAIKKWNQLGIWSSKIKVKIQAKSSINSNKVAKKNGGDNISLSTNTEKSNIISENKTKETYSNNEVMSDKPDDTYTATIAKASIDTLETEYELNNNESNETTVIKAETKNLVFKNSKTGKASFFFSGPSHGKFYVVTSVAEKGSIVKITNTENGKSIFAEVISPITASDLSKGIIMKISDNSKLPLMHKSSICAVKISY